MNWWEYIYTLYLLDIWCISRGYLTIPQKQEKNILAQLALEPFKKPTLKDKKKALRISIKIKSGERNNYQCYCILKFFISYIYPFFQYAVEFAKHTNLQYLMQKDVNNFRMLVKTALFYQGRCASKKCKINSSCCCWYGHVNLR